ncbi:Phosphoribosylformylglycinamidine synthase [Escherichia coli]|uniref:Phosphoribosylformylglycinamidine synthase n=1 Tax=Escherichia coli TaxID=562 RepID=A0A376KNR3_ECOLX|nr:Phosphoribosylformylglycinamidine synthase [Escherichia coli]
MTTRSVLTRSTRRNQTTPIRALNVKLSFDINEDVAAPYIATGARPKVAVLREQGVNSHVEMAAAFHRAGFDAIDVHMSDLLDWTPRAWKISTPWSRAVVSPTVMCWVPVKVGRSPILFNDRVRR